MRDIPYDLIEAVQRVFELYTSPDESSRKLGLVYIEQTPISGKWAYYNTSASMMRIVADLLYSVVDDAFYSARIGNFHMRLTKNRAAGRDDDKKFILCYWGEHDSEEESQFVFIKHLHKELERYMRGFAYIHMVLEHYRQTGELCLIG